MIFPGKIWGGAEQYVLDLGENLRKAGHQVKYVARPSDAVITRIQSKIEYSVIPMKRGFDFKSPKMLAPLLKDIDVVHAHELKHVKTIAKAAKIAGVSPKIIVTRHVAKPSGTFPWDKYPIRKYARIIFVGEIGKNLWCKANPWMPQSSCEVILNSIPDHSSEKINVSTSLRELYHIPPEIPILFYAGRIREYKGCTNILEALSELKHLQWKMIFAGDFSPAKYRDELTELATKKGIIDRIIFHGFSEDVRSLMKEADLGLAPSIVRESCHLVVMEMMQAGKCVITSDNGAQPEYVEDGVTGMLVNPKNIDQLRTKIEYCLENPQERTNIGNRAKDYFEKNLSYDKFLSKILKAYLHNT